MTVDASEVDVVDWLLVLFDLKKSKIPPPRFIFRVFLYFDPLFAALAILLNIFDFLLFSYIEYCIEILNY